MSTSLDDALAQASEAINALKRTKPTTDIQARARAAELIRLEKIQLAAAHKLADASAAKRVANGSNARAPVAQSRGISDGEVTALAKGLVPFLNNYVTERLATLTARIAELEAKPALEDGGTWNPKTVFKPNQVVTFDGTLWICKQAHANSRPPSDCWRMMVRTRPR